AYLSEPISFQQMPCSGRLREALGSAGLFASSEADVKIAAPTITFGPQHAPSTTDAHQECE
ncbi:MAG: hypothetical protein WA798_08780, partial [Candidatus Acidiferrum sp.]